GRVSRLNSTDDLPDVRTSGQGGTTPSRTGPEDDTGMLGHPHGLIHEPVCRGRQRHARIRRNEGSKPVCHWRIEPNRCGGTLTHDYIVVDGSRVNNRSNLLPRASVPLASAW